MTTHSPRRFPVRLIALLLASSAIIGIAQTTPVSSLDIHQAVQQQGEPRAGKSADNHPMMLAGKVYDDGLGTIAPSRLVLNLGKNGVKFTATVGVDDEVGKGRGGAVFKVLGDKDTVLWESPLMRAGDAPAHADVPLKGHNTLTLVVESKEDHTSNHANWADAKVELHSDKYKEVRPNTVPIHEEEAVVLTPRPGPAPRVTGAKVFGVRPGNPVLYTVTATGERPMEFAVDGLPAGLQLDPLTGRISGSIAKKGDYAMTVIAKNRHGESQRPFRILCGDNIGLVPAMGWNSWNAFGDNVTAEQIRIAADALVSSGLADHGWNYVVIDSGWSKNLQKTTPEHGGPPYDEQGRLIPNGKFPDMGGLVDHIHSLGLRAGIHTSPGPLDCDGHAGIYEKEEINARRFAELGFDYLKYDMCSYNKILRQRTQPGPGNNLKKLMDRKSPEFLAECQRPWRTIRAALDKFGRDIIFSISGNARDWGKDVGANSWRTSSDIVDSWLEMESGWKESVSNIGFTLKPADGTLYEHCNTANLAGPGHFNDFDMLVVGRVGWTDQSRPTRLTPNEQYTHVSLWSLLASPLFLGCDLTKMDDFTLGLLTNDEVLEVNQDPLGKQAVRVYKEGDREVWAKDMEDGTKAVGLFNRSYLPGKVEIPWKTLGLAEPQIVRDLWRQKDLGVFNDSFSAEVPRHGVVLVRVMPAHQRTNSSLEKGQEK